MRRIIFTYAIKASKRKCNEEGTPYFNFFHGDLEIDLMNQMRYDAATIGNHDFDGGIETLAKQITRANFPFVNCNYDFTNTPVENKVHKHIIIKKGKVKIGITGCGVELDGLVPDKLYTNTKYLDPIKCVQEQVDILKFQKKCHIIICLSHLGYTYDNNKISDIMLLAITTTTCVISLGINLIRYNCAMKLYWNLTEKNTGFFMVTNTIYPWVARRAGSQNWVAEPTIPFGRLIDLSIMYGSSMEKTRFLFLNT